MRIILIILLIFSTNTLQGQYTPLKDTPLTVGYFGHFALHPGIKIGTEYTLKNWEKTKDKKRKELTKYKHLVISPQIGFYSHFKNHSGLLFNVELAKQSSRNNQRFYHAWGFGLGYLLHINPSTTYIVNSDGMVEEKKLTSKSYIMPNLNFEAGLTLSPKTTVYSKIILSSKLFYNTGLLLEPFWELGFKFRLVDQ